GAPAGVPRATAANARGVAARGRLGEQADHHGPARQDRSAGHCSREMSAHGDWSFGGLWPYEPKWFESADGRMHYIDEGPSRGRPVVLVHGNPTWGFLYRHFVAPLVEEGYRVVVPDHLGF